METENVNEERLQAFASESEAPLSYALMSLPVEKMTLDEAIYAQQMIDLLGKQMAKRMVDVKAKLKAYADANGKATPGGKGHKECDTGLNKFRLQKSVSSQPDDDKFKALLDKHAIKHSECYDVVKTMVLNMAKVEFLVQAQKITSAEIEECKKIGWSLVVDKPEDLKQLLKSKS